MLRQKLFQLVGFLICALAGGTFSSPALAGLGSYLSAYRVTAEMKASATSSDLRYDTAKPGTLPDNCVDHVSDPSLMACSLKIGKNTGTTYALGLQQVFKRQGDYYFGADFGGSIFLLDAKAEEKQDQVTLLQPLQKARIHLYGVNVRAYIQVGITPARIFPDLLLSIGVGEHLSTGNIKIEDQREKVNVATGLGYVQFEIVWWRFKDGSLSSYLSAESGGSYRPKGDYGAYENLKIEPSQTAIGVLKLVLPWKTQ